MMFDLVYWLNYFENRELLRRVIQTEVLYAVKTRFETSINWSIRAYVKLGRLSETEIVAEVLKRYDEGTGAIGGRGRNKLDNRFKYYCGDNLEDWLKIDRNTLADQIRYRISELIRNDPIKLSEHDKSCLARPVVCPDRSGYWWVKRKYDEPYLRELCEVYRDDAGEFIINVLDKGWLNISINECCMSLYGTKYDKNYSKCDWQFIKPFKTGRLTLT